MKAVIMSQAGAPEVLQLRDVDPPRLENEHELLIRLKAAGINPVDTKVRQRGVFRQSPGPHVLGCDGAGIVEQVGSAVRRFQPGDEVYFCDGGVGGPRGNYAEYALVHERCVARKPASLDFVQAAAVPLVAITAWESLFDCAYLQEDQSVLIHAGAGGVGHIAIQLARETGARICTTVGSPEKAELVGSLGAELPILYKEQDFVRAVLDWTDGSGVDAALDTVGGNTFSRTAEAVAFYGDLVTLLQPDSNTDWTAARMRNLRISLELMLSPMLFGLEDAQAHHGWILEQCAELFDRDALRIEVHRTLPLEAAAEAHRMMEQGNVVGKLVLEIP